MSELTSDKRAPFKWQLLAGASAATLALSSVFPEFALAGSESAPTIWIEMGGQLEAISGFGDKFDPPFVSVDSYAPVIDHVSPLPFQKAPKFSNGIEGSITFEPDGSNWAFSASIQYGRSNGTKSVHHQTYVYHLPKYIAPGQKGRNNPSQGNFADITTEQRESHLVVDFRAGSDVGLGWLGSSVISGGVRFAQFGSSSRFNLRARPDVHWSNAIAAFPPYYFPVAHFHSYVGTGASTRSFHGLGPSLSWKAVVPVLKVSDDTQIIFDWGADASILFGRQKTQTNHQTAMLYYTRFFEDANVHSSYHHTPPAQNRSRFVTVPNVGGFAGATLQFPRAKLSLGYRADFFFGAIDGGIDTSHAETRGFYGPFATISIGLGG
jgi:hypothetical protein